MEGYTLLQIRCQAQITPKLIILAKSVREKKSKLKNYVQFGPIILYIKLWWEKLTVFLHNC